MKTNPEKLLTGVEGLIRNHGLPVAAIMKGVRVATKLVALRAHDAGLPPSASKFGGCPNLPPFLRWPTTTSRKLSFLAQLNLAEIEDGTGLLPNSGMLYFFYDAVNQPTGLDKEDAGCTRVLYFNGELTTPRRAAPKELDSKAVFHASRIKSSLMATLPRFACDLESRIDDEVSDDYTDFVDEYFEPKGSNHQLLGRPTLLQSDDGDMQELCRRFTGRGGEWLLLLQLGSDLNGPDWMWGDDGLLYFWIRREDLAAGRFDAGWGFRE